MPELAFHIADQSGQPRKDVKVGVRQVAPVDTVDNMTVLARWAGNTTTTRANGTAELDFIAGPNLVFVGGQLWRVVLPDETTVWDVTALGAELLSDNFVPYNRIYSDRTMKGEGLATDPFGLSDEVVGDINSKASQSDLNAERDARVSNDEALSSAITAETNARTAADTALGGRIDAETAARTAADHTIEAEANSAGDTARQANEKAEAAQNEAASAGQAATAAQSTADTATSDVARLQEQLETLRSLEAGDVSRLTATVNAIHNLTRNLIDGGVSFIVQANDPGPTQPNGDPWPTRTIWFSGQADILSLWNGNRWFELVDFNDVGGNSAAELVTKLQSLTGDNRLDASAIKNLPDGDFDYSDLHTDATIAGDFSSGTPGRVAIPFTAAEKQKLANTRPATAEEIRNKLQGLGGDSRLDASAIKDLPEYEDNTLFDSTDFTATESGTPPRTTIALRNPFTTAQKNRLDGAATEVDLQTTEDGLATLKARVDAIVTHSEETEYLVVAGRLRQAISATDTTIDVQLNQEFESGAGRIVAGDRLKINSEFMVVTAIRDGIHVTRGANDENERATTPATHTAGNPVLVARPGGLTKDEIEKLISDAFTDFLATYFDLWVQKPPHDVNEDGTKDYPSAGRFAPSPGAGAPKQRMVFEPARSNAVFWEAVEDAGTGNGRLRAFVNSTDPSQVGRSVDNERDGDLAIGYVGTTIALFRYSNAWSRLILLDTAGSGGRIDINTFITQLRAHAYTWALHSITGIDDDEGIPGTKTVKGLFEAGDVAIGAPNVNMKWDALYGGEMPLRVFQSDPFELNPPSGDATLRVDFTTTSQPEFAQPRITDFELHLVHASDGTLAGKHNLPFSDEGNAEFPVPVRANYRWEVWIGGDPWVGKFPGTVNVTNSHMVGGEPIAEPYVEHIADARINKSKEDVQKSLSNIRQEIKDLEASPAWVDSLPDPVTSKSAVPVFNSERPFEQAESDWYHLPPDGFLMARGNGKWSNIVPITHLQQGDQIAIGANGDVNYGNQDYTTHHFLSVQPGRRLQLFAQRFNADQLTPVRDWREGQVLQIFHWAQSRANAGPTANTINGILDRLLDDQTLRRTVWGSMALDLVRAGHGLAGEVPQNLPSIPAQLLQWSAEAPIRFHTEGITPANGVAMDAATGLITLGEGIWSIHACEIVTFSAAASRCLLELSLKVDGVRETIYRERMFRQDQRLLENPLDVSVQVAVPAGQTRTVQAINRYFIETGSTALGGNQRIQQAGIEVVRTGRIT